MQDEWAFDHANFVLQHNIRIVQCNGIAETTTSLIKFSYSKTVVKVMWLYDYVRSMLMLKANWLLTI